MEDHKGRVTRAKSARFDFCRDVRNVCQAKHSPHARAQLWATLQLKQLAKRHNIPQSHGIKHAARVLAHVRNALDEGCAAAVVRPLPAAQRLAIELAALLHDADDTKYFGHRKCGPGQGRQPNARRIIASSLCEFPAAGAEAITKLALQAIRAVSASTNGNQIPPAAMQRPELLFPRWADRLEAIGEQGVVRCWQYSQETQRPLYDKHTPAPKTITELLALATPERFARYQAEKASPTMIDHYLDKLLHLSCAIGVIDPLAGSENRYFSSAAKAGQLPLVEICLAARPDGLGARLLLAAERCAR